MQKQKTSRRQSQENGPTLDLDTVAERWGITSPLRAPASMGDLEGYSPSHQTQAESRAHAVRVEATRKKEKIKKLAYGAKVGGVTLLAAGVLVAAIKVSEASGNQEHAPWDHSKPAHISGNP